MLRILSTRRRYDNVSVLFEAQKGFTGGRIHFERV